MAIRDDARSIAIEARAITGLMGDAIEQLGKLVQNEVELAKAETSQKVAQAGKGIAFMLGAAILIVPVAVLLLIALAIWLQTFGLSAATAHLAAAGVGAVFSAILALIGKKKLDADRLAPKATLEQLRKDMQVPREFAR